MTVWKKIKQKLYYKNQTERNVYTYLLETLDRDMKRRTVVYGQHVELGWVTPDVLTRRGDQILAEPGASRKVSGRQCR